MTGGVDNVLGICCFVLRGGRGGGTAGQEACRVARVVGGVRTTATGGGEGVGRDLAGVHTEWEIGDLWGVIMRGSSTVGVSGLLLAPTRPPTGEPGGEQGGAVRGGEGGCSGVTRSSGVSQTVPRLESLLRIPESGLPQRELFPLSLFSSPSTVTSAVDSETVVMPEIQLMSSGLSIAWLMLLRNTLVLPRYATTLCRALAHV